MLNSTTWNYLTVCKQMSSKNSFKNKITKKVFAYKSYIYIKKQDSVLNNLQCSIWHKPMNEPTNTPNNQSDLLIYIF